MTQPVAWGWQKENGDIYDIISPEEHHAVEGEYTVPLYLHPPRLKKLQPMQCRLMWIRSGGDPYQFYLALINLLEKEL